MYDKPALTCLKYQVYLYGSEAITYLNTTCTVQYTLGVVVTEPAFMSHQNAPTPQYRQPSPALYGS
jgi:hypothetical protein